MEQRIIIKFLMKEGCKPLEICSRLKRQYGEKTLSNVSVYKWSSAFKKGRETVDNEPRERRPRTSITGENSDRVDALIRENRRITVCELSGILNISDGSVKTIIKQYLQYSKVCARWFPRLLTDEHKSTRLQVAQSLLLEYEQEGDFFGFCCDNGRDVGALLHAREQTFFNAVASPRISETQKSENHVICWEATDWPFGTPTRTGSKERLQRAALRDPVVVQGSGTLCMTHY
jgi:transposase